MTNKEKVIDLENGFELVLTGTYKKHFNYARGIVATYGSGGSSELFVRKKKKEGKN